MLSSCAAYSWFMQKNSMRKFYQHDRISSCITLKFVNSIANPFLLRLSLFGSPFILH